MRGVRKAGGLFFYSVSRVLAVFFSYLLVVVSHCIAINLALEHNLHLELARVYDMFIWKRKASISQHRFLSSKRLPSSMVRHRVEFARDVGRDPLREPNLAQLVVPLLVQELRELRPHSTEAGFSGEASSQLQAISGSASRSWKTHRSPICASPCESRYGGVTKVPRSA